MSEDSHACMCLHAVAELHSLTGKDLSDAKARGCNPGLKIVREFEAREEALKFGWESENRRKI